MHYTRILFKNIVWLIQNEQVTPFLFIWVSKTMPFLERKVFCQLNASFVNLEPPISTKILIKGDWFWIFAQQKSYVQKPNEHQKPQLATYSHFVLSKKILKNKVTFWWYPPVLANYWILIQLSIRLSIMLLITYLIVLISVNNLTN
jgi:hypothetical protein